MFKEYCLQDVETEMEVDKQLEHITIPEVEQEYWVLDTYMNAYGAMVDKDLVNSAIAVSEQITEELTNEAISLSGLNNPNSPSQIKKYISDQMGEEITSLTKDDLPDLIKNINSSNAKRVLEIRQELGKTSIAKYITMDSAMGEDHRVRGLLQYYGANRTGRWAGRLVQIQNLPRNYLKSLDTARNLVKERNIDALKVIYGNIPDTLSQLIRTAFIPPTDHEFMIADYSAIEARVIAWLAGEDWVLDVFRTHGKIYEATASQMFGIPIEKIKKGEPEYDYRQKGKVATLALGYQGSIGALIKMRALENGLTEEELPDIVDRWRSANKKIVDMWYELQNKVTQCLETGTEQRFNKGIIISLNKDSLVITLPSKRQLFYVRPRIEVNGWRKSIVYMGQNQTTKKWEKIPTYGGKLVENIVQAIARDCLAEAIKRLATNGYKTVFHIHDECVAEVPIGDKVLNLENAIKIMCEVPEWAERTATECRWIYQ